MAPGSGHRGVTAFVVERGDEGFTTGPPMRKMGQRAIVSAELFLDDVRLPADRRLGEEGDGFRGRPAQGGFQPLRHFGETGDAPTASVQTLRYRQSSLIAGAAAARGAGARGARGAAPIPSTTWIRPSAPTPPGREEWRQIVGLVEQPADVGGEHVAVGLGKGIEDTTPNGVGRPPVRQHLSGDLLYLLLPVIVVNLHQLTSTRLPGHVDRNERQILAQHKPRRLIAEPSIVGKSHCGLVRRDASRPASDRLEVVAGDLPDRLDGVQHRRS
jgi:hypothetical protein